MSSPAVTNTDSLRLHLHRWKRVLLGVFDVFIQQDTSLRCAGTAFFGFLSIFPGIATGVLAYGLLADRGTLAGTIDGLRYVVPQAVLEFIAGQLSYLIAQPATTLGIGLLISVPLALWSASRGVDALLFAMSAVRREHPRRGFIKATLISIGLSIVGAVFLIVALLTIAGLPALIPFPSGDKLLVLIYRWPILLVLTVLVLSALYRWGPDRHPRKWRYIWPGALLASLVWILAGAIFSIYVENFGNFEATFGSVSATVVLLLWMYNSAQVFVLGSAVNAQLEYTSAGYRAPSSAG